jgi:hypothetical protein
MASAVVGPPEAASEVASSEREAHACLGLGVASYFTGRVLDVANRPEGPTRFAVGGKLCARRYRIAADPVGQPSTARARLACSSSVRASCSGGHCVRSSRARSTPDSRATSRSPGWAGST